MIGKYEGFYRFNSAQIRILRGSEKTIFYCTIDAFDGQNFSGTVEDDLETGGMIGVGTIEGKLKGNKIKFVKRMPIRMAIQYEEKVVEVSAEPHPPIYYEGRLSHDKTHFKGTWSFNPIITLLYGVTSRPFRNPKGVWEMRLVNHANHILLNPHSWG